jgi:hypothetical protein
LIDNVSSPDDVENSPFLPLLKTSQCIDIVIKKYRPLLYSLQNIGIGRPAAACGCYTIIALVVLVSVHEIHIEIRAEAGAPISSVNMIVKWVIFQAHFLFSIPF